MARLSVEKRENRQPIPVLVATHLELEMPRSTAPLCMKALTDHMKQQTGNPALTIHALRQGLREWVEQGWVTIEGNVLQVTRAGRLPVRKLADEATAASPTIQ